MSVNTMTKEEMAKHIEKLESENRDYQRKCEGLYAMADEYRKKLDKNNLDVYSQAVHTYGETSRLILAIEEMTELTKELCKHTRGRNNIGAITEEMADVEIMFEQLKIIFSNRAAVDHCKASKLQRLADLMDGNN